MTGKLASGPLPYSALLTMLTLSGCTGVEVSAMRLVPPEPIGDVSAFPAPAIAMATQFPEQTFPEQTLPGQSFPAAESAVATAPLPPPQPFPPEAQAPIDQPTPPAPPFSSGDDVTPEQPLSPQMAAAPLPPAASAASPATTSAVQVQFLPIVGAPEAKIAQLAEALSSHAGANGIEIVAASEERTPKRLQGYFSAFNDGTQTTVIYVWDVLDPNDERVNRIQGQETVPGATSDPWAAIGANTLDAIAQRTLQETASL